MSNQKRSKNNANKKAEKQFTINIRVVPTSELIPQKGVTNDLTIEDLKIMAEYTAGVPTNLQRLAYLDQENLKDDSAVQDYDVVSNGELRLDVWLTWKKLIEVAAYGDSELLFQQGITPDSKFSSPTLNYMSSQERRRVLAERGFVALYVAAHHNHKLLCEILLKAGININATTSETGRTALHVAAAQGHCDIVDLLLEHGADIDIKDELGETAMMVASRFGNKECERHLFLYQWQQRAKKAKPIEEHDMFAHQYHDSSQAQQIAIRPGSHAQVYVMQILPPGEFEGTRINAPRSRSASSKASRLSRASSISVTRIVNSSRRANPDANTE